MVCYTDFFVHYCPQCGERLDMEPKPGVPTSHDYLEGATVTCSCGATCCYFPEHLFPYRTPPKRSETV